MRPSSFIPHPSEAGHNVTESETLQSSSFSLHPSSELFAVASPGLEPAVRSELRALHFAAVSAAPGGVAFRGDLREAARANLWLRSATRVLLRVAEFDAPGRRELLARSARANLSPFLEPGRPAKIHAACHKSRLYHSGLVEEVLREALALPSPQSGEPSILLLARLVHDRCTLSIDTSGELLHRRGWRQETSRAPLRETLAAGMLLLCGYDGSQAFADPMCGSGTLAIEAALLAGGRAPGLRRAFAIEAFPGFSAQAMAALRAEAEAAAHAPAHPILAADVHAGALASARRNAERAGVLAHVRFERCDAGRLRAPAETGLLLTNPPYGARLAGTDDAVAALDAALRGPFRTWKRAFLAPARGRRAGLGLPVERATTLDNGGIRVELVELAANVAKAPPPAGG